MEYLWIRHGRKHGINIKKHIRIYFSESIFILLLLNISNSLLVRWTVIPNKTIPGCPMKRYRDPFFVARALLRNWDAAHTIMKQWHDIDSFAWWYDVYGLWKTTRNGLWSTAQHISRLVLRKAFQNPSMRKNISMQKWISMPSFRDL